MFKNAAANTTVKVASSDDVDPAFEGSASDNSDSHNAAGVTLKPTKVQTKDEIMKAGGPKATGTRDTVKEQLKAVSGLSDQEARAWLSSLFPEDAATPAAPTTPAAPASSDPRQPTERSRARCL